MNTKQLINEVVYLPVEERASAVDLLLRSLNQPESEIDKEWASEAKRRLSELKTGHVVAIPGNEVFSAKFGVDLRNELLIPPRCGKRI